MIGTVIQSVADISDYRRGRGTRILDQNGAVHHGEGLEALTAECALAAHAADVVDEVFPSLRDGHPKIDVNSARPIILNAA